jgi:hypothetical protein
VVCIYPFLGNGPKTRILDNRETVFLGSVVRNYKRAQKSKKSTEEYEEYGSVRKNTKN